MAYIVRESGSELSEYQVIQFVAGQVYIYTPSFLLPPRVEMFPNSKCWYFQVAPYKKIKRVAFINAIPKSTAGKILRKDLMAQSKQNVQSKL